MTVKEASEQTFEELVLKETKPVFVDFYANWCGPCRMVRPILEELANEHEELVVVSINTDEAEKLSRQYRISSIPCIILFQNGEEITRSIGLKPKEEILKMLEMLGGN